MSRKRPRLDSYSGIPELSFAINDSPSLRIASVSNDGRRVNFCEVPFVPIPPSPLKSTTSAQLNNFNKVSQTLGFDLQEDLQDCFMENGEDFVSRRGGAADNPLADFVPRAFEYLLELVQSEGRGSQERPCICGERNDVAYWCRDCSEACVFCQACLVSRHETKPLHYVEKWNGSFFDRTTLKSLGLKVQLGHPCGHICMMPRQARTGFVVVDVDSIQEVDLFFCMCQPPEDVGEQWQQLMRHELFPATSIQPHAAFTFRLLRFFHTLTLQGKVNIYDYYIAIQNRTDGAGISMRKDRYEAFRRVMRQWRYLKMLKRAGIASEPSRSVKGIQQGRLAQRCLACPIPGVNLPEDWLLADPSKSFIYRKFVSVDACFRLKRRLISTEQLDPGLATGLAYFVPQEEYQPFQKRTGDQKEANSLTFPQGGSCSGGDLAAIQQANTKFNKGYATTGVVLCVCARHEVVEPNSAVDLDKGEKFALTDYSVSASQILSYDIACQYHKNFFNRLSNLPESIRVKTEAKQWTFTVPKLHIRSHGIECQQTFSLHITPGVGQSDCEGIERHWGEEGPIASSTREMGPGHRRDTVDDHFGGWSHRKRIGLGRALLLQREDARKQMKIHAGEFLKLCKSQSASVEEWTKSVTDWERGLTNENPYSKPDIGMTEDDIRYQYAQQEAEQAQSGVHALHDVSPSAFMYLGLDLEEDQRNLMLDLQANAASTVLQKMDILTRRAKIHRAIGRFRTLQQIYTPLAFTSSVADKDSSRAEVVDPERIDLILPSSLPHAVRSLPAMQPWVEMELKYRHGQLVSSAHEVRARLLIRKGLQQKRSMDTRGQKESRKSRDQMAKNDRQMDAATLKFRAAWTASKALHNGREDLIGYPYLQDCDIRMPEDPDLTTTSNKRQTKGRNFLEQERLLVAGESRKTTSWLWNSFDASDASKAIYEATRLEWMKARARDLHWKEELLLLKEEMRCTLATLEYEAQEWLSRVAPEDLKGPLGEGLTAYAKSYMKLILV